MTTKTVAFGSEPMRTIEQHQGVENTPAALHYGAMVMAGWTAGKMVTAAEYKAAIETFLKAEAGGKTC